MAGTKEQKWARSPHVLALSDQFNQVSQWVTTTIVFEADLEARRQLLTFFVTLARTLRDMNNLNGMMAGIDVVQRWPGLAIPRGSGMTEAKSTWFVALAGFRWDGAAPVVSGLTVSAVRRLKKLWASVDRTLPSTVTELETLMSRDGNFATLRATLLTVTPRRVPRLWPAQLTDPMLPTVSAKERCCCQIRPPALPYLGLFLTDMAFIDQGNSDLLPGTELINFYKRRLFAQVIMDIQRFQQEAYPFVRDAAVQRALVRLPTRTEDECYKQSQVIEPREEPAMTVPAAPAIAGPTQSLVDIENGRYKVEYPPDYPFREPDGPNNIAFMVTGHGTAGWFPTAPWPLPAHPDAPGFAIGAWLGRPGL